MRGDRLRPQDILEACNVIQEYTPESRGQFDADPPLRSHIPFHIQVIGEAVSNLSQALRDRYPHVPWKSIARMRNIIAHVYFGIDWEEVWQVACHDISDFKAQIEAILASLPPDQDTDP
jgi:uncharacterized protein with HEPN domain